MAKVTAVVVTIIGILLLLAEFGVLASITLYNGWLIAIGVLIIGITKLIRNFKK